MKLIVFDLDFTLWNAGGTWCDHTFPPYRKVNSHIIDSAGSKIVLYPDVSKILQELQRKNYLLGIASRTHEPSWATNLMNLFGIDNFFSHVEIYPGPKTTHFNELNVKTGIPYSEMLFFDDEERNINDVSGLGVNAVLVPQGISLLEVNRYLNLKD
jgi:magnesium-dependent phosphatase 1